MTSASCRTSGDLPASAKGQGHQLIVYSVDKRANTTFTCTVSNALGTGRAEQLVLVRGEPVLGAARDGGSAPQVFLSLGSGAALGEAVPPARDGGGETKTRLADRRAGQSGFSLLPPGGIWIGVTG